MFRKKEKNLFMSNIGISQCLRQTPGQIGKWLMSFYLRYGKWCKLSVFDLTIRVSKRKKKKENIIALYRHNKWLTLNKNNTIKLRNEYIFTSIFKLNTKQ